MPSPAPFAPSRSSRLRTLALGVFTAALVFASSVRSAPPATGANHTLADLALELIWI